MPLDLDGQSVVVHSRNDFLSRRDTNTVIVRLEQDEALVLIRDLAQEAYMGTVWLVIESDRVLVKDMD